uniref:Elements of external origin n=1 Tax=Ralstonia solanacearum TaxID=305 RepID=A0A0S4WN49_RALSL|nr:protein of unknown function [Ralstonia solanacearum]
MGISIRGYARHRGVSDAAVRKAIAAGRITPEAGGTIDSDRADAEWARNTEAPSTGTRIRPVRAAVTPEGGRPRTARHRRPQAARRCCRPAPSTRWSRRKPTGAPGPPQGRAGGPLAGHRPRLQAGTRRARCVAELADAGLRADGRDPGRRSAQDARCAGVRRA